MFHVDLAIILVFSIPVLLNKVLYNLPTLIKLSSALLKTVHFGVILKESPPTGQLVIFIDDPFEQVRDTGVVGQHQP